MKKITLISMACICAALSFAQINVPISGSTNVTPGSTTSYSTSLPSGGTLTWYVSGGVFPANGQTTYTTNSTNVNVQWGTSLGNASVSFT